MSDPDASDETSPDILGDERPYRRAPGAGRSSMLGAAMLGLGDIIEPTKTSVEIEAERADDGDEPDFDLDFGDLPGLD